MTVELKQIEIYSETSNLAIVRMPGRRFPGCVIQGDSLSNLLRDANVILERAKALGDAELIDFTDDLVTAISGRLDHYETVLQAHGIDLPYVKRNPDANGGSP